MTAKLTVAQIKQNPLLPVAMMMTSHFARPNMLFVNSPEAEKPVYLLVNPTLTPYIDGEMNTLLSFSAEINSEGNYDGDSLLQILEYFLDQEALSFIWLQEECGNANTLRFTVKRLGETEEIPNDAGGNNFQSRFIISVGVTPEVHAKLAESYQRAFSAILKNVVQMRKLEEELADPAAAMMQSAIDAAKNPPTQGKENPNGPL
jgi:hypothetical protein